MNPVEQFLTERKGIYYGIKKLAKITGFSKRKVCAMCFQSSLVKLLDNRQLIGSGKYKPRIFFC
jgi:hypothetical protein